MVSLAGRTNTTNSLAIRKRFTSLYYVRRLIGLCVAFVIATIVIAQGNHRNLQVELVTETFEGNALLHIRLPRGQTIEEASLIQNDNTITLESDGLPLPVTQFIVLDSSNEMVNLQSVVQANIPRFWRNTEQLTSLIFFDNEVMSLQPTNRTETIDNFLVNYTAMPGSSACLGEALTTINDIQRDYERSWRILLITGGNFSPQANCAIQNFSALPAPVDVIAITDTIDDALQDLVNRSGGQIFTANLRSVEARTNEVLSQWGQSSYALRGTLPDTWNSEETFELEALLSNGIEETIFLDFREYNVPIPITEIPETVIPSAEATIDLIPLVESTAIATSVPEIESQSDDSVSSNVAILLVIGAVLFIIGAIILALALSRVRGGSVQETPNKPNFYQTLNALEDNHQARLDDDTVTKISTSEDLDELLVTQVLTDNRFQDMMKQSRSNDEIVGWLRLVSQKVDRDFNLTMRGIIVGRSQECDIQITGDRAISRKHIRLDVRAHNQVTVSRLSAVNPVLVGGIQVNNRHPLNSNDVIHLSDETRLIFIAKDENDENDDTNPI